MSSTMNTTAEFLVEMKKLHTYLDKAEYLSAESMKYNDVDVRYSDHLATQSIAMSLLEISRQLQNIYGALNISNQTR